MLDRSGLTRYAWLSVLTAIEEFVNRIPKFSLKPDHDVEYHLGMIQPVTLPLVW